MARASPTYLDTPVAPVQRRLVMAAFASLALGGCARMKKQDQRVRLDQALTAYVGAIRWGNFETAAAFAVPRDGRRTRVSVDAITGLKVTGFSTRINRVGEDADEADVTTGFTYYHEDRGTIRQIEQDATWYFDEARGTWLMDGNLPDFSR